MRTLSLIIITILSVQFVFLSCTTPKQVESSNNQIKTAETQDYNRKKHSIINNSEQKIRELPITERPINEDKSKLRRSTKFLTSSKLNVEVNSISNKNYNKNSDTTECDLIILENGNEIDAKVKVVSEKEIKYKKCTNLRGPLYTKSKNDVFLIKYANGTKDVFNQSKNQTENAEVEINNNQKKQESEEQDKPDEKSLDGFSLAGGIIGIVSGVLTLIPVPFAFWILFLIISLAGLVFSIIGVARVGSNKERLKGLGWGITGMVISTIAILVFIIALALL